MGYEGSWSGMRKHLEKEMLADSLKGRIRYGCTRYGNSEITIFEVYIDNIPKIRFSWDCLYKELGKQSYANDDRSWSKMCSYIEENSVSSRDVYVEYEFCEALEVYRNQDIKSSLQSNNPIVRMFAILDRRVGKRTLIKIKDEVNAQPDWLKEFYLLRLNAEIL